MSPFSPNTGPEGRITIRRHLATYLVAANHPAPDAVRGRMDAALAELARDLGAALAPLARGKAEGVWLLREVTLDNTLDTGLAPAEAGRRWAGALAAAIASRLDLSSDGVMFFPDRAAHLARFLADLAGGDAWGSWIHVCFGGLRALPTGMALRTAILAEPAEGLAALTRLAAPDLARVLEAMGSAEAARVLDGLAGQAAEAPAAELAALLAREGWPPVSPACPDRLGLALFVAAVAAGLPPGVAALVRALALLRHHRATGAAEPDVAALARRLGASGAAALLPLLRLAPEPRAALLRLADPAGAETRPARHTPFGGGFLLLRFLDEWRLDAATAGWPAPEGATAAALLRALVLARCTGGARAAAFLLDPLWRDVLGLPPRLGAAAIAAWGRDVRRRHRQALRRDLPPLPRPDAAARRFLSVPGGAATPRLSALLDRLAFALVQRMAAHLPGLGGSSPAWLARNILAVTARTEQDVEGLTVTLSRPPLDVVLGMTGLARATLRLPWLVGSGGLTLRREA
ncbi:hypothetical protein [Paracraurococcus lichenis]|uniref:Uncharacterized protein n=1 Tax=Paracraurococcus lichenis TaxID=3064888 RepID=A0ABT9E9L2_9PROT|nr:hypothetical protein [Paracraurococcus sp. LOR1-02]MDO9712892.1 hypothetical protein [Paracraurococcus sp. LOR1-02]